MNKITLVLLTALTLFSCNVKHGGNTNDCDSTVIDSTAIYNTDGDSMKIEDTVEKPKVSSFEGMYYCSRTNDHYEFFENKTGVFVPSGNTSCMGTFKWKRNGKKVVITYTGSSASFGKQTLLYSPTDECIIEQSPSLGSLEFDKVN